MSLLLDRSIDAHLLDISSLCQNGARVADTTLILCQDLIRAGIIAFNLKFACDIATLL